MKQLFLFTKNYRLGFHLENMPNKDPLILRMLTGKMETPALLLQVWTATTNFIQTKKGQTMRFTCVA